MIARSLVHNPRLLILDEPTAGVDIEIRRTMWEFMEEINTAGTTIILTTHYLEEAESLCRNIAIIDGGKIVENARMDDLLRGLHAEHFVLSTSEPLTGVLDAGDFGLQQRDECTLEAKIRQGQQLNELFRYLDQKNIQIVSMRNKENRLERFFVDKIRNGGNGNA